MRVDRSWRVGMAAGAILVSGGCAAGAHPVPTAPGGEPGTSRIVIRSASTIARAAEQPLYVIEGAVLECEGEPTIQRCRIAPAEFDPARVESVEVLKPVAATTRYGERGRNGAIIIRMKPPATDGERSDAREER